MKKLIPLIAIALLGNGCVMAYHRDETSRSWLVSAASRSVIEGFRAGVKTKAESTAISIDSAATEAQSDLVEAAARGAAKGAIGK